MNEDEKICPHCAETIKKAAIVCRYCNRDLASRNPSIITTSDPRHHPNTKEIEYYQDSNVTITSTRAIFGTKTYSMSNITSVSMGTLPAEHGPGCMVMVVGAVIIWACASVRDAGIGILIGIIAVCGGIWWESTKKQRFIVRVGSASAESNALVSFDREYISKIVAAVNKAIVDRG